MTPATGNSSLRNVSQERWALLGCSRGLGRAFLDLLTEQEVAPTEKILIARKIELLKSFESNFVQILSWDFSKQEEWPALVSEIKKFAPTRLIYFAGGGPFGNFESKSWKDHEWALRVTFLCPAFLLHSLVSEKQLQQITFVGSQIAEATADPSAASYCAGKHALKGLLTTVMAENKEKDLRLFSPGYLDTDLLPANAWPRQHSQVDSPKEAAKALLEWLKKNDGVDQHLRWTRSPQL